MNILQKLGRDGINATLEADRTMGWFATFSMWLAANMVVTTIYTGMFFVPDLPFATAIWIILIGSVVGVIPLMLVGTMGAKTGLTTMTLTRGAFGTKGSVLPSVVNIIILIGWSWVQALMAGMSMNYAISHLTGYSNLPLFTILCETMVVIITLLGHKGIEVFEKIIATAMLLLSGAVFFKLFTVYDINTLLNLEQNQLSGVTKALAFDMVVATAISWAPIAADYNRNCKTTKTSIWGTMIGYVAATLIAMGTGAIVSGLSIVSSMEQTFDPTVLLAEFGFGLPAAFVIFISVMTTNIMCVYSSTMSYLNIRPKATFWKPALVIGVISIFGALYSGILDSFVDWILTIGALFTPIFAILLADFIVLKKRNYSVDDLLKNGRNKYWYYKGFNIPAWIVYFITAGFAYYWTVINPLAIGATIPVFLIGFFGYIILSKVVEVSRSSKQESYTEEHI
ncbi:purine-cytosine permease family protein [Desulfoscipio geothermicus]|uniref:Putative hydroxymethylpyrimidine transporter CytX n=1 Tax=Desulfoscipio geothermicus DSM 3669 TaxID=1121426 RepID=A0A1I6DIF0_9FIRM|nr:cytosine permease [Desulfoscipio geothermicus]SFR05235.1 putative hydroxymethylpyrimidine transporter CytX [Desulfoscipio geothermicus DSM 3669]